MKPRSVSIIFTIFLLVMMLFACAHSTAGKAYDVIYTAAEVYDAALSYAGDQYKAGKISDAQKKEIINYARRYQTAVRAAQTALHEYRKAQLAGDRDYFNSAEESLDIALQAIHSARAVMRVYIQSSVKGGTK
jgi:hypothetical protein